jgi:hypothetical protein
VGKASSPAGAPPQAAMVKSIARAKSAVSNFLIENTSYRQSIANKRNIGNIRFLRKKYLIFKKNAAGAFLFSYYKKISFAMQ